jgi:hypothetical protein
VKSSVTKPLIDRSKDAVSGSEASQQPVLIKMALTARPSQAPATASVSSISQSRIDAAATLMMLKYSQHVFALGEHDSTFNGYVGLASLGKAATVASLKAHVLQHISE